MFPNILNCLSQIYLDGYFCMYQKNGSQFVQDFGFSINKCFPGLSKHLSDWSRSRYNSEQSKKLTNKCFNVFNCPLCALNSTLFIYLYGKIALKSI